MSMVTFPNINIIISILIHDKILLTQSNKDLFWDFKETNFSRKFLTVTSNLSPITMLVSLPTFSFTLNSVVSFRFRILDPIH